ncbi:transposase [Streptomyces ipomoeae]|uniref:Transposase, IS605 OrfB family protein n=1 Tax=Streptomyces ipomoeae 91-03 TaxID=698759 RepID=L1KV92_9ACTN|nr:RNA-guided endonuclease TnpB family protein [Streptomyces ipomoeae]EKX64562.1 transposase, IS605 OrfB family protein [Streptomyces ipomoeae 91-03]MDX2693925.1 transposase [Streptomyces ipomoeae]MDX2823516.1 transposase [Streptomyces ipomoeae]MDX2839833.1 transposase [Streptomyces ipomoeae]MDX2876078.1 transposase [Streptomyces ipomoeae]
MIRAYKFLLRPTARQTAALGEMLRDHCSLYNGALQERRDAYQHASKTAVRYGDQSAQLKEIRAFDPERQGRWSFSSQQATLRRLDKAFAAFFRRVKAGQTPGYPRFKGVGHFGTVTFPKDGDGCRWDSTPHDAQTRVRIQGVGHIRVHRHRPVQGRVKTVSVKREGARWYVVLACDNVPAEELPPTGAIAGIDMGIAHFLTTSDGEHVANPRFLQAGADELAEAQRHLATFPKRTRQRTKRHRAAARKVAKLHAKIRRQRADFHHKTARALITDHDVIAHERLNTAGMTKSPAPKADPEQPGGFLPNGAAAKAGLNRSILDAGWAQFLGILANKAESAGRLVVPVDARNTSRTCPDCGHVAKENRLTQAKFQCTACGFTANADHVGATNVLSRAGLVLCAAA